MAKSAWSKMVGGDTFVALESPSLAEASEPTEDSLDLKFPVGFAATAGVEETTAERGITAEKGAAGARAGRGGVAKTTAEAPSVTPGATSAVRSDRSTSAATGTAIGVLDDAVAAVGVVAAGGTGTVTGTRRVELRLARFALSCSMVIAAAGCPASAAFAAGLAG